MPVVPLKEVGEGLSLETQIRLIARILLLTVIATGCQQGGKNGNGKPTVARCMEELNSIPELAALKRREEPVESSAGKPLDGLEIALTINDMIRGEGDPDDVDNLCEHENSRENFDKLVGALREHQLPPTVAFVVGQTLDPQIARDWVASGNQLGSLTYSLVRPNRSTADEFITDIARNDQTIGPYQPTAPARRRYFRFPRLKVSLDAHARATINDYLRDNHYMVAMATIEARDAQFNRIYCSAVSRNDASCIQLVKAYFRSLLLDTSLQARESARQLSGRDVKHILVVKADQFTCDSLAETLGWYKSLGARFISLEEALRDPFYSMIDEQGKPVASGFSRALRHAQSEDLKRK